MLIEVAKTDFLENVSASIPKINVLILDSESLCLMVLFIWYYLTNSYAPGGSSFAKKLSRTSHSNSGILTIC